MAGGGINSTEDKQIIFPKHNPSWEIIGLDEAQAVIKIPRRNINNLRYADDTTLMTKSKEELGASWWKWKRRVKKLD